MEKEVIKALKNFIFLAPKQTWTVTVKNMSFDDVKSLAKAFRGTKVIQLKYNEISCIKYIIIASKTISEADLKYIFDRLRYPDSAVPDPLTNQIGADTVKYLSEMTFNEKIKSIQIEAFYSKDRDSNTFLFQMKRIDNHFKKIHLILRNNKLGSIGARIVNKNFRDIIIYELELCCDPLEADDVEYLAQAFKKIQIQNLHLHHQHFEQSGGVEDLIEIFRESHIAALQMSAIALQHIDFRQLTEFLKHVKIVELRLCYCLLTDEDIEHLAAVLPHTDIMYLYIGDNKITDDGVKYLAAVLKDTKIIDIDLSSNPLTYDSGRRLAEVLPHSQVFAINLSKTKIPKIPVESFVETIDRTSITMVKVDDHSVEATIPLLFNKAKNATISRTLSLDFKELVSFNLESKKFEFRWKEISKFFEYLDNYIFLFKTLQESPNSKVHIFDSMCKRRKPFVLFDTVLMKKIDEFIAVMPKQFIADKLLNATGTYDTNTIVNVVKKFDDMHLDEFVEELLLHRVFYYVDENQEFLHPYVYLILEKHNMPLYNEQLEPNKRAEIIAYFQEHQEIDGAQKIVNLLQSKSFE